MAQNRYIPYGYKIENGAIAPCREEAEVIRRIYSLYVMGQSYKAIALALTEEGLRYASEKPDWNKNMVARILQ